MRLERFGERHHSVADVVMVLAVVCSGSCDVVVSRRCRKRAAVEAICQRCVGCAFDSSRPDPPASLGHLNEISVRRVDDRSAVFTQIR